MSHSNYIKAFAGLTQRFEVAYLLAGTLGCGDNRRYLVEFAVGKT